MNKALAAERHALALRALLAMAALNGGIKADGRRRADLYALKARLVAAFWREGYCAAAEIDHPGLWCFTFRVQGRRVQWHLPASQVTFRAHVFRAAGADSGTRPFPPASSRGERIATVRAYLRLVGG